MATEQMTTIEIYQGVMDDIEQALAVGRRSALLLITKDDGSHIQFNLHDPYWRFTLFAFRYAVNEIIACERAVEADRKMVAKPIP